MFSLQSGGVVGSRVLVTTRKEKRVSRVHWDVQSHTHCNLWSYLTSIVGRSSSNMPSSGGTIESVTRYEISGRE
ncbi:hypothetical protein LINPERPRIM_LOCUS9203 [Linum perenne]